jgi:hypothetical protein
MKIKLRRAPNGRPGYGELVVSGWRHGASACKLCVQRNQDQCYLGEDKAWDSREVWHSLPNLREGSEGLLGEVGPWLVDEIHGQQYMLFLSNAQGSDKSVLSIVDDLLGSEAAGNSRFDEKKVEHATTPAPKDESVIAAEPSAPPPSAQVAKTGGKRPLILIVLLLVLALAAAAGWFLLRKPSSGDMAVCGPQALAEAKDDLPFIQTCLKSNPSSEEVLKVIAAARDAKRCDVAQRLYAHKAQSGDAAIAYAYAREYDPAHYAGGGCIAAANGETAAYWYEIAVQNDPQNQDAQQRLKELRK